MIIESLLRTGRAISTKRYNDRRWNGHWQVRYFWLQSNLNRSPLGGSVSIPAAFNGLYSLKPSHGRISMKDAANSVRL